MITHEKRTHEQRLRDTAGALVEVIGKQTALMNELRQQIKNLEAIYIDHLHNISKLQDDMIQPTICDRCHDSGIVVEHGMGRTWPVACPDCQPVGRKAI
jgi:hypothetical protein